MRPQYHRKMIPHLNYDKVFHELQGEIHDDLFVHGKALFLNKLLIKYNDLLQNVQEYVVLSYCCVFRLIPRFTKFYGSKVVIERLNRSRKPYVILSSNITLSDSIEVVQRLKDKFPDSVDDNY